MKHIALCRVVGLLFLVALLSSSPAPARAGMVSIVFDDGLESVYQYAFPVLEKLGLPATVGIIANRVGRGDPDFMTVAQIRDLAKAGWEVASHSLTHKRPIDIPKFYAQENCLLLKPVRGQRAMYEAKYKYEELAGLVENGKLLRERSSDALVRAEPGSYYFDGLIGEVLVHPFEPAEAAKQQIRAISYEREMDQSKTKLAAMGFAVTTYITPHNYWTPEMSALSKKFYSQVADGGDDCNHKGSTDRFWLKRYTVHSDDTAVSLIDLVKKHAIREDAWVIFCMHGIGSDLGWEPWDASKLAELAEFLKKQAVPVVTIDQGVKLWFAGKGTPRI